MLKTFRQPPDNLEDYKTEFGYLGPLLHAAVVKARQTPTCTTASNTKTTFSISQVGGSVSIVRFYFSLCCVVTYNFKYSINPFHAEFIKKK